MISFYRHHADEYHDVYIDDLEVVDGDLRVYMQQDNAPCHKAKKTHEVLAASGMRMLEDWPPCSPDLNPIEGVWGLMKKRIAARQPRPYTKSAMHAAVREEWDRLQPSDWAYFIDSMPQRIRAVIEANGGPTRY